MIMYLGTYFQLQHNHWKAAHSMYIIEKFGLHDNSACDKAITQRISDQTNMHAAKTIMTRKALRLLSL